MAQKHNSYEEKPMTRYGTVQGPSRRYRRLRNPTFSAAEWTAKNPLLQRGEIGYEVDTHHVKVGDGLTYWNDLPYIFDDAGQPLSTADYQMGNAQGGWTTMSQAQQDALNSGATTTNIGQIATNTTTIGNHIADTNNPHSVTKAQVGLGNVDNTSDLDKPISTATQNALDLKANTADLGTAAYTDSSDYATSAQGAKADTALQPGDNVSELVNDAGYLTQHQTLADLGITATAAEINVLDGITATTAELNYVDGVTSSIQTQITTNKNTMDGHIANTSNPHSVTKSQVGLGNCDNTSDLNKPISTATQTALNAKQDVLTAGSNITISGNTISATDTTYTGSDGITLTGTNFTNSGVRSVASGTANGTISVNTNGTSADVAVTGLGSAAYTASSDYATAAQGTLASTAVQPGDLATVATTGDYGDLLNKPTIPTVNNATLTIQKNGTNVATFTANASSAVTANISVPTTAADIGAFGANDIVQNLNSFTTKPKMYFSTTDNVLFSANRRFAVAGSGFDSFNGAKLFDGSYEDYNQCQVALGGTGTLTITGSSITGVYRQGYMLISFYSGRGPANLSDVSITIENANGNIATPELSWESTNKLVIRATVATLGTGNAISKITISVANNRTSGTVDVVEVEYFVSRPSSINLLPVVVKNANNVIYGSLTADSLIKSGGTSAQFLKADGSTDSNTYATTAQLPTVNDGTINVTQNGVSVGSFTMNQANSDTIALTDTTYSVMTGASAGDAGTSGLVPAPAAGDQGKFLQGDGTWANPTVATAWGDITGTLSNQTDLATALSGKADTDLSNLTSTGKSKLGATVYGANGLIFNCGTDPVVGTGHADVYLYQNGLAVIEFCLEITTAGVSSSEFLFGLNRDALHNANNNIPLITPVSGVCTYFDAGTGVVSGLTGYAGVLQGGLQFWRPCRVYDTLGNVGGWPTSSFPVGTRIVGTVYGTYTV